MSGLGMFLGGAGAIIGFGGAMRSSRAVKQIAKQNAQLITWEGRMNAIRHRKEVSALLGAQTAAYAKGGVLTTEGTAADVTRDTAIQGERDALLIQYEASIRADIVKRGGQAQASAIRLQGVGNLFGGAGSMFGMGG